MASTSNGPAGPSDTITRAPRKRAPKVQAPVESDTGSETDSSEDVTEDEDGVDLTPALDAAILRTLAKIRNKRGVYEGENVLDDELKEAEEKVIKAGIKVMPNRREEIKKYTLADHHRAALLNGEAHNAEEISQEHVEPLTHVQTQYKLRTEAVSAFKALADSSESDGDDEGGLLTKRKKDESEVDEDDEEYRRFLLEMGGGEEEVRKILGMGDQPINTARTDEEEPRAEGYEAKKVRKRKAKAQARKAKEDDDFLMNYILNRGWIDRTESHVPTYDEIVGRSREGQDGEAEDAQDDDKGAGPSHPWGELDEEDEFDEKAEEFETAYNFRFEEPGAAEILTHPREIASLVRRTDDTRATKRAAKAERKAAERAVKEEEARRQKGEKRREMEKQMSSLRKDLGFTDGDGDVDWDELEKVMEGEYDEGEWERVVGQMLEKQNRDEEEEDDGEGKPEWEEDVVEMEYEDADDEDVEMHMSFGQADGADEGPINMDADFEGEVPSKKKRKRDRKGKNKADDSAHLEADQADESLTVAQKAQKVKKAMEEYNALDHEDMIGDMPTRFKYTKSKPTAFGLTPAEILLASDAELDAIAGLKHIAPYRKQGLGMQGRGISKRIWDLKQKLRGRKWGEEVDGEGNAARQRDAGWGGQGQKRKAGDEGVEMSNKSKKRMGKKQRERERKKAAESGPGVELSEGAVETSGNRYEGMEASAPAATTVTDGEGKKKRKKRGSKAKDEALQIFD